MKVESLLVRSWYGGAKWTQIFAPLTPLVNRFVEKKRARFLANPALSYTAPVPVIIIGNISAGGTGKSPMVVALCEWLKTEGFKPGIISRGHGVKLDSPVLVTSNSRASDVGDEPAMLARRTQCPMVVFPKRVEAIKYLLSQADIDVILCDDGMQHYALNRDIEIAMIDAQRGVGNGQLLPVGPLREPVERLASVDYIVSVTDHITSKLAELSYPILTAPLESSYLSSLDGAKTINAHDAFKGDDSWHVMAGIGNPERFLTTLKALGLDKIASVRWFVDHYVYQAEDIPTKGAVVMTEKDAVKCQTFTVNNPDLWYLPVSLTLPSILKKELLNTLQRLQNEKHYE